MARIVDAKCVGHNCDLKLRGSGPAPKRLKGIERAFRCPEAKVSCTKSPECEWVIEDQPEGLHGQPPN